MPLSLASTVWISCVLAALLISSLSALSKEEEQCDDNHRIVSPSTEKIEDETPSAFSPIGGSSKEPNTVGASEPGEENEDKPPHDHWTIVEGVVDSYNGHFIDLWEALDCDTVFEKARPIPNQETWQLLRGIYQGVVGPDRSTIDLTQPEDVFLVPIKITHIPGKGRGLIANQYILEGTQVCEPYNTAQFPSAVEYRRFIASLPGDLACDAMMWSYVQQIDESELSDDPTSLRITIDFDGSSLVNCIGENEGDEALNVNDECVAVRNIRAGEELITDYSGYAIESGWGILGLADLDGEYDEEEDKEEDILYLDPWTIDGPMDRYLSTQNDLQEALDCEEVFEESLPIHNLSTWMYLRGAYQASVGPMRSTLPKDQLHEDGFLVPVQVQYSAGKRRGVFATQNIPEGTVIWTSLFTGRFSSGAYFRRFLASIPSDLACDVLLWAYAEYINMDNKSSLRISLDLDAGSFINTISEDTNKTVDKEYMTMRDIKAGEELIMDYLAFEDVESG